MGLKDSYNPIACNLLCGCKGYLDFVGMVRVIIVNICAAKVSFVLETSAYTTVTY